MTTLVTRSFTRNMRVAAGAQSLLAFARLYFPSRFTLPWNRMHREVAEDLTALGKEPVRIAVGAPDGYGKSSLLSFALPLWALSYGHAQQLFIGSDTRGAAGELLRKLLQEACNNPTLRRDSPRIDRIAQRVERRGSKAFSPRSLTVPGVARLCAFGPNSAFSEMSFEGSSAELVILDDPDYWDPSANQRYSQAKRSKHLLGLLDLLRTRRYSSTSIVVCGALTHAEGVIDSVCACDYGYLPTRRFYKAVQSYPTRFERWFEWAGIRKDDPAIAKAWLNERRQELLDGARMLWPEHESFEELMEQRAERGWDWFDQKKQGLPAGGCLREGFSYEEFRRLEGPPEIQCQVLDDYGYRRGMPNIRAYDTEGIRPDLPLLVEPGMPLPNGADRSFVPYTF